MYTRTISSALAKNGPNCSSPSPVFADTAMAGKSVPNSSCNTATSSAPPRSALFASIRVGRSLRNGSAINSSDSVTVPLAALLTDAGPALSSCTTTPGQLGSKLTLFSASLSKITCTCSTQSGSAGSTTNIAASAGCSALMYQLSIKSGDTGGKSIN